MADYYVVELAVGPDWDRSRARREQEGWHEHAVFMDSLAEDGFIVLGGPIGDGEYDNTLHIVDADGEDAIRARFAEDPWSGSMLTVHSIRPWHVWLRGDGGE